MGGGLLDVVVLVLPGANLRREDPTTVDLDEIAVRELVASLAVRGFLVIHAEVPLPVLVDSVLGEELVLLPGRGLMLAPRISLVEDDLPILDQSARLVVAGLVQLDCHGSSPSSARVELHDALFIAYHWNVLPARVAQQGCPQPREIDVQVGWCRAVRRVC